MGGSKRANAYSRHLQAEMVLCYKLRKKPNVVEEMSVIGEIEGKNVIIIDDMVDTAGTLVLAADMMKKEEPIASEHLPHILFYREIPLKE